MHTYKQLKGLCFGDQRFAGWKRRKLRSVDVTALFTSVPVDETLASGHSRQIEHWHHLIWQNVIDNGWYHHASETVSIMHLHCVPRRVLSTNPWSGDGVPCVSYCLQLVYQWKIMRKGHWRPHLIHHVSRNVTLPTHSRITKREYSQEFCDHLNSVDPEHNKWTSEAEHGIDSDDDGKEEGTGSELKGERAIAFLDTLVVRQADGSVRTKVSRKDTHTDPVPQIWEQPCIGT